MGMIPVLMYHGCLIDPYAWEKARYFSTLPEFWLEYPLLGLMACSLLLTAWIRQRRAFKRRLASEI
jgi:hypothetical protein